jgi:hypothetical protein
VKPDDFELFAQYHLGLLPDGTGQFQNANQIAARYGVGMEELRRWLADARIDAETADGTDYDLPAQHGEAQVLAMLGDRAAALAFARHVYEEYRARLGTKKVRTFDDD